MLVLKNTNAKELVDMLPDIKKRGSHLSPGQGTRFLKEFRYFRTDKHKCPQKLVVDNKEGLLTDRQLEVLEMVTKGITYKEAGVALGLTERTIKYHMGRIIELLQLENRAQVIAYAARIGLIQDTKTNG